MGKRKTRVPFHFFDQYTLATSTSTSLKHSSSTSPPKLLLAHFWIKSKYIKPKHTPCAPPLKMALSSPSDLPSWPLRNAWIYTTESICRWFKERITNKLLSVQWFKFLLGRYVYILLQRVISLRKYFLLWPSTKTLIFIICCRDVSLALGSGSSEGEAEEALKEYEMWKHAWFLTKKSKYREGWCQVFQILLCRDL